MSGAFVEDPWTRIIGGRRKKKDDGEPPEPPPIDHLCGFYERHNGIITWSRFNPITQANETVSMGALEAAEYAQAYYELHDPPGYPHDERNHGFNGFWLTPTGITWNTRVQPVNAFNVVMQLANRFRITIRQSITAIYVPTQGPGTYGYYPTWTNFLDVSTWVWLPFEPFPMFSAFPSYPHGLGYSSFAFVADDISGLPPRPPTWFVATGVHGLTGTTTNLSYTYIAIPPNWKRGEPFPEPSDPFDPSQYGGGAFWFMNLPEEGPQSVLDPRYPNNPPEHYVWVNNVPNTSAGSEDFFRIDGYCLNEADHPFPQPITPEGIDA